MKKLLLFSLLITALSFSAFRISEDPLPLGAAIPKPDVKMKDISGQDITLKSSLKDNGLLVMFSCNTCPVVIKHQGRTKEICQYALDNKVGVVLLNSNEGSRSEGDGYDDMKEYAKEQGYKWNYAVDKNNELADAFGANRTPECFLFDKNGKLVYHGAIDDNPNNPAGVSRKHLKEAINEIVNGKDVSVKESRSVGCNIKRI
jgi:thioredoxin-related protein